DVEAHLGELAMCGHDLAFRDSDGCSAGPTHGCENFPRAHWLFDRRALRNGGLGLDSNQIASAGQEGRMKRRAIFWLNSKESRQASDLAAAQQLTEANIAAKDIAARARWDENIIGCPEAEVLPELIRQRLRPLEKEGLPVVAGVEDVHGLPLSCVGRVLPGSRYQLYFGAVNANLYSLSRLGVAGN